jgi:hypothetical protein
VVNCFTQMTPVYTSVAPKSALQGTGMSFVGRTRHIDGLDVTAANPGSPPREAPV